MIALDDYNSRGNSGLKAFGDCEIIFSACGTNMHNFSDPLSGKG
jgi:hypothetical protein